MTQKQLLIEQFIACYNEPNWFVPLTTALDSLTAGQAGWKSNSTNNSIWQIVNHLIFWNRIYLNRFIGIPNPGIADNDTTFEGERISGSDEEWKKTVNEINHVFSEWLKVLKEAEDSKMDELAFEGAEGPWAPYLGLVNIHNAYHIGQIVTLRKQQGSWDSKKGVN